MATLPTENEGLIDGMPRDKRGHWQPEGGTKPANPVFAWPPKPAEVIKWFYHYLCPWNLFYMLLATVTWLYFQPDLSRAATFSADWIVGIFIRNQILLIVFVSIWHIRLWGRKSQGLQYKYTSTWLATQKRQFLWRNQLYDNIFWSCVSGGIIWTVYEVLMFWAYANQLIPYIEPLQQPIYFVCQLCLIPLWRLFHFYWVHRLLHWPPLYKAGHYLHHKNINVGPWSGLAMHPVEHILYYSCLLIHWIVPSHPIHLLLNAQHASLMPAQGHVGFEKVVVNDKVNIAGGSYFHQLHHRYFECNYGEPDIPFDHWFGTNHDGSAESHKAMRAKRKTVHAV